MVVESIIIPEVMAVCVLCSLHHEVSLSSVDLVFVLVLVADRIE